MKDLYFAIIALVHLRILYQQLVRSIHLSILYIYWAFASIQLISTSIDFDEFNHLWSWYDFWVWYCMNNVASPTDQVLMLEVLIEKNYFSVTNNNKESPDVSSILFLSQDIFLTDLQNVSWHWQNYFPATAKSCCWKLKASCH